MVSIIIPVYKAERYIKECLNSICQQTYKDIEILIIDDCGDDDSIKIAIDFLSGKNCRFNVLRHDCNKGPAAAKNTGLEHANGEFVIFLDSDDYWLNDSILSKMIEVSNQYNADIVRGAYLPVSIDSRIIQASTRMPDSSLWNQTMDSPEFVRDVIRREWFMGLNLIRRDSIGGLRLPEEYHFLEDACFLSYLFCQNLKCVYIPELFYAYRRNTDSISFSINENKLEAAFSLCRVLINHCETGLSPVLSREYMRQATVFYKKTLGTIGETKQYYDNRKRIIDSMSLIQLQHDLGVICPVEIDVVIQHYMRRVLNSVYKIKIYIKSKLK